MIVVHHSLATYDAFLIANDILDGTGRTAIGLGDDNLFRIPLGPAPGQARWVHQPAPVSTGTRQRASGADLPHGAYSGHAAVAQRGVDPVIKSLAAAVSHRWMAATRGTCRMARCKTTTNSRWGRMS